MGHALFRVGVHSAPRAPPVKAVKAGERGEFWLCRIAGTTEMRTEFCALLRARAVRVAGARCAGVRLPRRRSPRCVQMRAISKRRCRRGGVNNLCFALVLNGAEPASRLGQGDGAGGAPCFAELLRKRAGAERPIGPGGENEASTPTPSPSAKEAARGGQTTPPPYILSSSGA